MAKIPAVRAPKADVEVSRALAKAYWREVVRQTNPTLGEAERKANWAESCQHYMKLARKVLGSLHRAGYKVQKSA